MEAHVGKVNSNWDSDQFNESLSEISTDATVSDPSDSRTAWQINYNYQFNTIWSVDLGYLDWGDAEFNVNATVSDINTLYDLAEQEHPSSGSGFYIGPRLSHAFNNGIRIYGKAGVWRWSSDFDVEIGDSKRSFDTSGTDSLIGFGVNKDIKRFSLGALIQRAKLDDDTQNYMGLVLGYRLGE